MEGGTFINSALDHMCVHYFMNQDVVVMSVRPITMRVNDAIASMSSVYFFRYTHISKCDLIE